MHWQSDEGGWQWLTGKDGLKLILQDLFNHDKDKEIGFFEAFCVKKSRFTEIFYGKVEIFGRISKNLLDLVNSDG